MAAELLLQPAVCLEHPQALLQADFLVPRQLQQNFLPLAQQLPQLPLLVVLAQALKNPYHSAHQPQVHQQEDYLEADLTPQLRQVRQAVYLVAVEVGLVLDLLRLQLLVHPVLEQQELHQLVPKVVYLEANPQPPTCSILLWVQPHRQRQRLSVLVTQLHQQDLLPRVEFSAEVEVQVQVEAGRCLIVQLWELEEVARGRVYLDKSLLQPPIHLAAPLLQRIQLPVRMPVLHRRFLEAKLNRPLLVLVRARRLHCCLVLNLRPLLDPTKPLCSELDPESHWACLLLQFREPPLACLLA